MKTIAKHPTTIPSEAAVLRTIRDLPNVGEAGRSTRKYDRIQHQLRHALADLPAGTRIPTVRDLAAAFDVSQPPVLRAVRCLAKDGLVETRRGSGTFICPKADKAPVDPHPFLSPETTTLNLGIQTKPEMSFWSDAIRDCQQANSMLRFTYKSDWHHHTPILDCDIYESGWGLGRLEEENLSDLDAFLLGQAERAWERLGMAPDSHYLPLHLIFCMVAWRRSWFEQHGIEQPTGVLTLQQLIRLAKQVREASPSDQLPYNLAVPIEFMFGRQTETLLSWIEGKEPSRERKSMVLDALTLIGSYLADTHYLKYRDKYGSAFWEPGPFIRGDCPLRVCMSHEHVNLADEDVGFAPFLVADNSCLAILMALSMHRKTTCPVDGIRLIRALSESIRSRSEASSWLAPADRRRLPEWVQEHFGIIDSTTSYMRDRLAVVPLFSTPQHKYIMNTIIKVELRTGFAKGRTPEEILGEILILGKAYLAHSQQSS